LEETPKNATGWSRASMAKRSGLSRTTIGRIWKAFEIKPHRVDGFKLSSDLGRRSHLKPYGNDRLGHDPQAGIVAASMTSHELVGLIDRDGMLLGGYPLGLFNDDP
jgi:hypothetical protein